MHDTSNDVVVCMPTTQAMQDLGAAIAGLVQQGDVILLSGPLGAGKTTFAQGFGRGLGIHEPIVSPTFTIARELKGTFVGGSRATLVHVDAYRLGGDDFAPGQDTIERLLDELESLGLDEALESPGDGTVVLLEWGEQMAQVIAQERLEIHIDRTLEQQSDANAAMCQELSSDGDRIVTIRPVGADWVARINQLRSKYDGDVQIVDKEQQ